MKARDIENHAAAGRDLCFECSQFRQAGHIDVAVYRYNARFTCKVRFPLHEHSIR